MELHHLYLKFMTSLYLMILKIVKFVLIIIFNMFFIDFKFLNLLIKHFPLKFINLFIIIID
jgi:hypothetical protein